ncbi:hypothetical protein CEXT_267071 [Caerostris extrusa]|uniref:Uncharacterized protein n=1 Tax=Caerostris extrusa TaxID=172846 RepID=A0AAV4U3G1_CAEEX|nr:hypothetical protein CEXT_267071 [Caerostris extrusa]
MDLWISPKSKVTVETFTHLSERSPPQTSITPRKTFGTTPITPLSNVPIEDVPFRTPWFDEPFFPPIPKKILLAVDDYWPSASKASGPLKRTGRNLPFSGQMPREKFSSGRCRYYRWRVLINGITGKMERSLAGSIKGVWDKEDGNQRHAGRR